MNLILEGNSENQKIFDGKGSVLQSDKSSDAIIVRSLYQENQWLVPQNITIKNYVIEGSIRVYGLGMNGQGELVKQSSRNLNHTEFCQSMAPKNIIFENLKIIGNQRIPFYVSPGCTHITLKNCVLEGESVSTAIYSEIRV